MLYVISLIQVKVSSSEWQHMEKSLVTDNEIDDDARNEMAFSLGEGKSTVQPGDQDRQAVYYQVRNHPCVDDCCASVGRLHYNALQVTRIIELLGTEKSEEQNVH